MSEENFRRNIEAALKEWLQRKSNNKIVPWAIRNKNVEIIRK
jgi:hypothetical protein